MSAPGAERPWVAFYGDVPSSIDYPSGTVYDVVMRTVEREPDTVAYDFLGRTATYRELGEAIDRCADGLAALGLGAGDRLTISMPTSPQGVVPFYAVAKLGAVASLIHPLSTPAEIERYLDLSRSRVALTLDAFYDRFAEARPREPLETIVLARISDALPPLKRIGYWITRGRKVPPVPEDERVRWWSDVTSGRAARAEAAASEPDALAAVLYSGGTTGIPKGIMLSHRNLIASGLQVATWVGMGPQDTVLAALPIFHGFGLAALVHAGLVSGARVVMVPIFGPSEVAEVMRTKRPTLMAGVPTLYEALARSHALRGTDLSCLRAAFSGADTLAAPVREAFEGLVAARGGRVRLLEGYGLTESVAAVIGTPIDARRDGSVGVPFPDMDVKVCRPGTTEAAATGEEGEICISGPSVMLGYLDDPEATAETLKRHDDGRVWLHTGDLAAMDSDGYVSFVGRLKRMIKSSGFNVYPSQVEAALCAHPAVQSACVIGVPDAAQGERVKAFVVPSESAAADEALAAELISHCRERLIKWSCPREVEFRRELPTTKLGKIDFRALAREELERAAKVGG